MKMKKSKIKNQNLGFTLVELLVALVILAVLLAIATKYFVDQNAQLREQEMIAECQQNARSSAELISRELKLAGFHRNNVQPESVAVTLGNVDQVRFTLDLNGNRLIDFYPKTTSPDSHELRGFALVGDTLMRYFRDDTNQDNFAPVAFNIRAIDIHYFNIRFDGVNVQWIELARPVPVALRDSIRYITVMVRAETRGDIKIGTTRQRLTREFFQTVNLRNRGRT